MECLRILLCSDFPSEEVASSSSLSTTELGENERERPEEASFSSVILTKRLYYSPPCLTEEP